MVSWRRWWKSVHYARRGLAKVVKEEQNFRIELAVGALVLVLAAYLRVNYQDLVSLIMVIALVLCLEIVNTVAELISDAVQPKLSQYARYIKDVVAAGVLLAALAAAMVGLIIFAKYL